MSVTTSEAPISPQTAEAVLATGDLSRLTAPQRVEYVLRVCKSMGLNPFTRPIRFLRLNNEIQPYFTRDGCDQLRKIHNISLHVVEQKLDAGVYTVRVTAKMPSGREDEDVGAVTMPQAGESRANAVMRALTKAKRRVTLSICGLGFISEDEMDTLPGAQVFDADTEPPPQRQAPVARLNPVTQGAAQSGLNPPLQGTEQAAGNNGRSWAQWAESLALALHDSRSTDDVARVLAQAEVQQIYERAGEGQPSPAKSRILALVHAAQQRIADLKPPDPDEAEAQAAIASWDPPPAAA